MSTSFDSVQKNHIALAFYKENALENLTDIPKLK